ncbi:hypothetical protein V1511DRAFT_510773 [Dipodascopsis uninucleata]
MLPYTGRYIILLVALLWAGSASANIEQVRFFAPFTSTASDVKPFESQLHNSASFVSKLEISNPSRTKTVSPKFASQQSSGYATEEYYLLSDINKGSFYEFRVCWPANSPLDLKVGVVKASDMDPSSELYLSGEQGDAFYAYIKYSAYYYSDVGDLLKNPRPVTFELILSKCTFLVVLGDSVAAQSLLVILGVIGWRYAAPYYYNFMRSIQKRESHSKKE